MSLFAELRRRKVFKVGAAYLVVGWLVIQVAATILPQFDTPAWAPRLVTLLVALGLPIALVMAWVFDITPEGVKADASRAGSKRIIGAAVVLAALALGWYVRDDVIAPVASQASVSSTAVPVAAAASSAANSIAVLPFVDMSQARDQEYFSDGLSEELLNLLAQVPQLRVIARTSSFSFKDKDVDVATIARTLNVGHVLEGSVRKSGNTLRITAQLVRASDSSQLWSQTFDRELTDVFKVQDEIAVAVVDALKVKLLPDQHLNNPYRSANTEAYNQYLLGREFYNRQTPADLRRSRDAFERAIALDPDYGAAHAGLAAVAYFLADMAGDRASKQQALAVADQAVAKAPQLAEAYAARGTTRLSFFRDWKGARADYEQALQLNPASSRAQIGYYRLLMALGRHADAVAAGRAATAIDPLALEAWTSLGRALYAQGEHAAAHQALARALEIAPDSIYAGFAYGVNELLQGRAQQALEAFRKSDSVYRPAGIAMAEHSLGHARESQQALDEAITTEGTSGAYQIAQAYAWRGETDKAFEWLDLALVHNDGGLTFLKSDPVIGKLAHDPRFAVLLEKMGLPG
jgi:serine/threonine-protein kinase